MMSMVLAMGSAVPAHADTEISENNDLAENGQGFLPFGLAFVYLVQDFFRSAGQLKLCVGRRHFRSPPTRLMRGSIIP